MSKRALGWSIVGDLSAISAALKEVATVSESSTQVDRLDFTNAENRKIAVNLIRRAAEEAHPRDWHNRCAYVAFYGIQIVNQFGGGYRIAAGRVEDLTENPPLVLWKGTYEGSGWSSFHVWIVGPNGEKIDCSVVPHSYDMDFTWEPYESLPKLRYTEIPDTTASLNEVIARVVEQAGERK